MLFCDENQDLLTVTVTMTVKIEGRLIERGR